MRQESFKINLTNVLRFAKIPRSTYYYYERTRNDRHTRDAGAKEMIESVFELRDKKIGIRQLKMELNRIYDININCKKIARIKREYGLTTLIRKVKPRYYQKNLPHRIFENVLGRNFSSSRPMEKVVTDITELRGKEGRKYYLVAFKDLYDKSILSYRVSTSLEYKFVGEALKDMLNKRKENWNMMVHSDQGIHFTCRPFVNTLKQEKNLTQSMSRKGNCWDNAPMESFFGLIKDHLNLGKAKNLAQVEQQVEKIIEYYNYERPQIGLNKMPPIEYRRHAA